MLHPDSPIVISGDKNNLDESNLLLMSNDLRQIVTKNTRKRKNLTIIITDVPNFYQVPIIIPPVPIDNINKGVPSDHNGVLALPLTSQKVQINTPLV